MRTVGDIFSYTARYYPENIASIDSTVQLTYKELNERANMIANGLLGLGVTKGERIGVLCHTSHYFQEIFCGVAKIGAIFTSLNWRLSPKELEFVINDAEVSIVFVAERFWSQIKAIKKKLPKVKKYILIDDSVSGTIGYSEFINDSSKHEITVDIDRDDIAWLIYTSGTTGRPKGVMLTHRNILADTEHNIIGNKWNSDNVVWLQALPMFHIAGKFMFIVGYVHGTMVLMDKFDLGKLFETIEKTRCTHILLAPTMWRRLLNFEDIDKYDLSSLQFCSYSTEPMEVELLKRLKKKLYYSNFFSTYGLTEAGSSLTILPLDQHITKGPEYLRKRLGSSGRPMYGVDVRIVDDNGKDCPPGVVGEIIGRGDNIMKGYWKLPKETSDTIKNGWLHTGDMGYWDEYGYIYMAGRKKELIISGGENIYPKEVEDTIREVEGVIDVAVVGIPDKEWGEAVKAVVIKKPDVELTEDDIIDYCAKNIASYKKPKSVDFVSEFPRNAVGKILKKEIRAKYSTESIAN